MGTGASCRAKRSARRAKTAEIDQKWVGPSENEGGGRWMGQESASHESKQLHKWPDTQAEAGH
eukprot:12496921-Alexandrium_andersonii.AAC.1